jgi:histidine triad (HIT) family protein
LCSIPAARIWIDSEYAIAVAADAPVADGHIVVTPKEHVPTIHALPIAGQRAMWALVSEVRRRLRTGLAPAAGFAIGIDDGLTAPDAVAHTIVHVIPRRADDAGTLPSCSEWIDDKGILD